MLKELHYLLMTEKKYSFVKININYPKKILPIELTLLFEK